MSLHATLSPEVLRRLESQKRNSTITSVLIAMLGVVLLGVCLMFLVMPAVERYVPDVQVRYADENPDELPRPPEITRFSSQRKPAAPSSAMQQMVSRTRGDFVVPVVDSRMDIPGINPGDGDGTGIEGDDPWGEGGIVGRGVPNGSRQRCSKQERLARLNEHGGGLEVEEAVVRALRWMKERQNSDGSWGDKHKVGMTGIALLAYLGHCETPASEEFGESCLQALVYLIGVGMKGGGKLATDTGDKHWPYEHAIATYALAEAYSFGRIMGYSIPNHENVLGEAGMWIIEHQHGSGGWDYAYDMSGSRGGDLSIAAWHIQALKACKVSGLEFPGMQGVIRSALKYVGAKQGAHGGFGYTGVRPVASAGHHSLTGAGVLAYQMWGKGGRGEVRKGARYIISKARLDYNGSDCDLYAHYYHSQAMMQRGGEQWSRYNSMFRDQILLNQREDGSWKRPGGNDKPKAVAALFAEESKEGVHYRTALCALMLEVYYRYLPGTH